MRTWLFPAGVLSLLLTSCWGLPPPVQVNCISDPPPKIVGSPPTSANVGVQYLYDYTATYSCLFGTCYDAEAQQLPPGATIDHYNDLILWTPTQNDLNRTYTFSLATPPDMICGNQAVQSWTVTVGPEVVPPAVATISPANGSSGIAVDAAIVVTFDEAIDPLSLNADSLRLVGPGGRVPGVLTLAGSSLTFTPNQWLAYLANYSISVAATLRDLAGNELGSEATAGFATGVIPDPIPPSTPGALSATMRSSSRIDLAWNAASDNVIVAGYRLYRDGQLVAEPSGLQFGDSGLGFNRSYCYRIASVDGAGNESLPSAPLCSATPDLAASAVGAWGSNDSGQLGDGTTLDRSLPVEVSGLSGITAVAAAESHSLALKADGTVWGWGWNFYSQLGDGTTSDSRLPIQALNLNSIVAIAAGGYRSLALKSDGSVWSWGGSPWSAPMPVAGAGPAVAIAARFSHALALRPDGTLLAWGTNNFGQLGDGTTIDRPTPIVVAHLTNVVAIAAGNGYSLALKADGTLWAWGWNYYGQLGDATTTDHALPAPVSNLGNVVAIAAGTAHALALEADGSLRAWGRADLGQLGEGAAPIDPAVAVPVRTAISGSIAAIAAGGWQSLALKADGSVWIWGMGNHTPAAVANMNNMAAVAAGYAHVLVLKK